MVHHVYILLSETTGRFYVGSCEDVTVRLSQHNTGRNKSTKAGIPWKLMKVLELNSRAEAVQRETFIKKMKSRKYIQQVIDGLR